jgi:hypothetical protein
MEDTSQDQRVIEQNPILIYPDDPDFDERIESMFQVSS